MALKLLTLKKNNSCWKSVIILGAICAIASNCKAQDTIPPIITLMPSSSNPIELSCAAPPYVDPGAVAMDDKDGDITNRIIVTGTVNTRRIGTYTLTYTVTDNAGNLAVKKRNIVVATSKNPQDFNIIRDGNDFIFHTGLYSPVRTHFRWYLDDQYIKGSENIDSLYWFFDDTVKHTICLNQYFCNNFDTVIKVCNELKGIPQNGIWGTIFKDENSNCSNDALETGINQIPVRLYDAGNTLISTTYSHKNGAYHFIDSAGPYRIEVDTAGLPVQLTCAYPGNDTTITLPGNKRAKNIDFGFTCLNKFDVAIKSCAFRNILRPGRNSDLDIAIGETSQLLNMDCNGAIAGQVRISVVGKVSFVSKRIGALTPDSIVGKTFYYKITDFTKINTNYAFGTIFKTDTNAQVNDTIKVSVDLLLDNADINASNNSLKMNFAVANSHDPNIKEVYPSVVEPDYTDWLTYTIHFQNTGNAEAINIRVRDTLDTQLANETFQYMGGSHTPQISLTGKALMFYFPDIMLADSTTDEPNSHGYIQYRIKPKDNPAVGAKIHNTAFIYFDYNKPVVTNTATTRYLIKIPGSIKQVKENTVFTMYPNPNNGLLTITAKEVTANIEIYTIYGQLVYKGELNNYLHKVDISNFANGYYMVKLSTGTKTFYEGLIKE